MCCIYVAFRGNNQFSGAFENPEKRLLRFVMRAVRMEELGSHWTDFYKTLYLSVFRESVDELKVSFKSNKNIGYIT
jgi:hypothetical protein